MNVFSTKIAIVSLMILLVSNLSMAQTGETNQDNSFLTPQEFDNWVDGQLQNLKSGEQADLAGVQTRVTQRLEQGMYTTDDAILESVKIFAISDFETRSEREPEMLYATTVQFIDEVLKGLYKQKLLKVKLMQKKAEFLLNTPVKNEEIRNQAFVTYLGFVPMLETINYELDNMQNNAKLNLADTYQQLKNDKEQAEKYYIDVLQYPFYTVEDPNLFRTFRDQYVKAGLGRIKIRRGDLKALQELAFVPATNTELNPLLKSLIEEAGGTWDRDGSGNIKIRGN